MNREQIIEVLLSVRTRKEGEGDPAVEEAFSQMEQDPSLRKIWEEQSQWDQAFKKSMNSIPVPVDLRSKILELNSSNEIERSNIIPFARYLWIPFAAAALILLSFTLYSLNETEESQDFVSFEEKAVDYTQGFFTLSKKSSQLGEVREWLKGEGAAYAFQIPFQVERLSQLGCRQVNFCGIRSSMICFQVLGSKNELHLFVFDKNQVKNLPPLGSPCFSEKKGNSVASWTDDRHGYVLTGDVRLTELKGIFETFPPLPLEGI